MLTVSGNGVHLAVEAADGGRITRLVAHGRQWLAPSGPRTVGERFPGPGTGGWDDVVPTVSPCRLPDGTELPDHGDAWRRPWTVTERGRPVLGMRVDLLSLPVTLERRILATEDGVRIDWTASTWQEQPIPLLWSAHPLFSAPRGTVILSGAESVMEEYPVRGRTVDNPGGIDAFGPGSALKAFVSGSSCASVVHADDRGVQLSWDPVRLPHLGLYWDRGVFTETPVVSIEPTTGPGDSAADVLSHLPVVHRGRPLNWWIEISAVG